MKNTFFMKWTKPFPYPLQKKTSGVQDSRRVEWGIHSPPIYKEETKYI